jgi:hypothetical protein
VFGKLIAGPHYVPRPEFDHAQHNEPNPILVEVRRDFPKEGESYDWWAWAVSSAPDPSWTPEQIDHARRVLTRLATLSAPIVHPASSQAGLASFRKGLR